MSSRQNFQLRRLTTPEEVRDLIFSRAAGEGWRPGALDHVSFFDNESLFFVGQLDGKPITSVFFTKHGWNYMYGGGLIVHKQYRGKGYAKQTLKLASGLIDKRFNIGGDTTPESFGALYKTFGFKQQWYVQCFDIKAFEASKVERHRNTDIVKPTKELFPALLDYDIHIHVHPRPLFLEKWVFAPNCHCSVAINSSTGGVVGYGVVRATLGEENGWRVGPLFADSTSIARALYHDLFVQAADESGQRAPTITLDVSHGKRFSPESLSLVTELGGIPTFQMMRVYRHGVPTGMPLHKVFVMS